MADLALTLFIVCVSHRQETDTKFEGRRKEESCHRPCERNRQYRSVDFGVESFHTRNNTQLT